MKTKKWFEDKLMAYLGEITVEVDGADHGIEGVMNDILRWDRIKFFDELLTEGISRRDAELLEKVEGKKKYLKNLASGEILPMNDEYNRAIDEVIKLIKGG